MYGKLFESLYKGSMIGAGAPVFAVWCYVIANQKPDVSVGAQVELNPKLIAFIIGEPESAICEAITFLCSPDPKSTSKEQEGRRLVKLGEYSYQVVTGAKYHAMQNEGHRREYNRIAQAKHRAKFRPPMGKTLSERLEEGQASCT